MTEQTQFFVSSVVDDYNYDEEPFKTLLTACLLYLSAQDLSLISKELQEYILLPHRNSEGNKLFISYPGAQLMLSEFRTAFRTMAEKYKREGWMKPQDIDTCDQVVYVHEIIGYFSLLLSRRLDIYAAGLDINVITSLSSTKYESKSPGGESIAIVPSAKWLQAHAMLMFDSSEQLAVEKPYVRAIRKQINICGAGALAVCKDESSGVYKTMGLISQEDAFKLPRFVLKKHAEWVFCVADSERKSDDRVCCCNGFWVLPQLDMRDAYLRKLNETCTPNDKILEVFGDILDSLEACSHGAILIVMEEACISKEKERLISMKRGTYLDIALDSTGKPVHKMKLSDLIRQLSAVDGAIILDFNGVVHAFGVILDGLVLSEGCSARGSRYNSTKTYTEWFRKEKYTKRRILGIVRSEDGMIDVFDGTS